MSSAVLSATTTTGRSTLEHRTANLVGHALVIQDEFAIRIRRLFALPTARELSDALPSRMRELAHAHPSSHGPQPRARALL
jgi:hypothetical protein